MKELSKGLADPTCLEDDFEDGRGPTGYRRCSESSSACLTLENAGGQEVARARRATKEELLPNSRSAARATSDSTLFSSTEAEEGWRA